MPFFDHAGVKLAYDDTAHPSRPPLVLLHGWCSAREDLAAVADALAGSHRVISLDLPGHGESEIPADEERIAVPALADDVVALCRILDLNGAVLVGHSFGAAVAVEVAARHPELAAAVVALEGTLIFPAEALEQAAPLLAALRTPGWRDALRGFLAATFLPTDDPALQRRLVDRVGGMAQHVAAGLPEQFGHWDGAGALRTLGAAGTPLLYIEATGGLSDLDQVRTAAPQLAHGRVVGVGHDQMLETPDQSIAMMERFLATTLGRAPVDNTAPVRALFTAVTGGDLDAVGRLVAADFVDHGAPPGMGRGREGYQQLIALLREALQLTWEPLDLVADGERVMLRVRVSGRHAGEFAGIPPTGREFSMDTMHLYRVEDGVIREHWAVRDDLGMFRQLGLVSV